MARSPALRLLAPALLCLTACGGAPVRPAAAADPCCDGPAPDVQDRVTHPATRQALAQAGVPPDSLRCKSVVTWDANLDRYARQAYEGLARRFSLTLPPEEQQRAVHHLLGYLVRVYFERSRPHNLGVMALKGMSYAAPGGARRPLLIFRSGLTLGAQRPLQCFDSLLGPGGVRHVINLYDGSFPFDDVIDNERQAAARKGVSYFDIRQHRELGWRQLVEHPAHYAQNVARAQANLARLIREQVLRPGGAPPRGNLYIHCCGGMHRSGMLFAVLRKCVNGEGMETITPEYLRHTGFTSPQAPGGSEPLNLRFIREFDCRLLSAPPAR